MQPEPIELWPHPKNNTRYSSQYHRSHAFQRYRDLNQDLGLLRVSLLVNDEASQVFYGANEFRFSGINGWMVFSAYLNTIGSHHYRFLQRVTIHVPFPGVDHLAMPTYSNRTLHETICRSRHQWSHFQDRLVRYGLHIPANWSYDYSVADCVQKLGTTTLQKLTLVLPPTYQIKYRKRLYTPKPATALPPRTCRPLALSSDWYWGRLHHLKRTIDARRALENCGPLNIQFLYLKIRDTEQELYDPPRRDGLWLIRYTGQVKRMVGMLRATEWIDEIVYGVHDRYGRYEIMSREACECITGPRALQKEEQYEEDW